MEIGMVMRLRVGRRCEDGRGQLRSKRKDVDRNGDQMIGDEDENGGLESE